MSLSPNGFEAAKGDGFLLVSLFTWIHIRTIKPGLAIRVLMDLSKASGDVGNPCCEGTLTEPFGVGEFLVGRECLDRLLGLRGGCSHKGKGQGESVVYGLMRPACGWLFGGLVGGLVVGWLGGWVVGWLGGWVLECLGA